ncbi:protein phosphatase regulator [Malassezia nana]|uniref:Protein phosphatase regulator n=1 Tax=Malassezia nana TaxID=180528 RepID=A0AAF0EM78_9BASI|nr:protein phosphatase regulator [Malassezia nana]
MDEDIAQFINVTGASPDVAKAHVLSAKGDVAMALSAYFDSAHDNASPSGAATTSSAPAPKTEPQGPRTLSGVPLSDSDPWPSASASSSRRPARPRGGGIMTFRDLRADADMPEDRDDDDPVNLYTGGERSGLNVENPRQSQNDSDHGIVNEILSQAAKSSHRPPRADAQAPGRSAFSGKGYSIDGATVDESHETDGVEEDASDEEPAVRYLTFWADGFSIGDGPLMRYEDPGNQEMLEAIHAGRAPLHLLNVRFGQPVELVVTRRTNEKYVPPPPPPMKPFEGVGNRLGAPSVDPIPSSQQASDAAPPAPAAIQADPSQPMTQIQVRLPNGQRLIVQLNLTHTVADLRNYIVSQQPTLPADFTLRTSFPPKPLQDSSLSIADAGLANAVVVVT